MNPLAAAPLLNSIACERVLPAAAAVAVFAPLAGIAGAQLAGSRLNPRLPAGWSLATSLAAALTLAWAWRSGPGQEVLLGPRLAGGSLVHLDGLTAILLPLVAIVVLAITLVAPRRAVTVGGVTRLLAGGSLTAAFMTTSHPVALVLLWVASLVPTWLSTRATPGGRPTARVYALMMGAGSVLFAVGVVLMIFQQVNGVNMMLLYGPSILQDAGIGSASDAIFFTIFLNLFILAATVVAFALVRRFGRRQILMTGVAGMAAGHLLMAANFFRGGSPFVNLAAMILAAGSFTLSLAPVGWIVVSEIYPNRIRAKALAVVCCLLYLASFLCAQFFPMITAACAERAGHPGAAYLLFAAICLSCVAFVWKWLPETKDLALESIGRFWVEKVAADRSVTP